LDSGLRWGKRRLRGGVFKTAQQQGRLSRVHSTAAGDIESIEVPVLEPHGGDLGDIILIRGDPQKLAQLRGSEEFSRLNMRAGFSVEGFGVVSALLDDEAARFVATANDITADLR